MFFWRLLRYANLFFGYFGRASLGTVKVITYQLAENFDDYLHAKNITSSFTSFLRYYIWKNPAIWLADSILAHNLRATILSDIGFVVKYQ